MLATPISASPQSPCLSCSSVVLIPGEDQLLEEEAVHNGCLEDHQANGSKVCTSFCFFVRSKDFNRTHLLVLCVDWWRD